ncbi:MAG TPA: FKBP-type peptidyl-prolyl cis-trans isomerase [Actinoplanes sp.]|nr:FKBP-type peptidyl-prolyl cis-trans isomerase [Actinoplanes sp.]
MTDQPNPAEAVAPSTATAADGRRRRQAIAGALAGVAVIALLVAVFVIVQVSGGDDDTPAAAPPPASAPADPATPEPAAPSEPAAPQAELDPKLREKPVVEAGSGTLSELKVTPLVQGTGPKVAAGQQITVNYVGVTYADGQEFDSSWRSGQPFQTPIGTGQLIPGWDQGLVGVPVGSRVQLDIPADLAYGENPTGGQPAGDLRFVVDILQAL